MLKSTHAALRPGTDEFFLCSANLQTGRSAIFLNRTRAGVRPRDSAMVGSLKRIWVLPRPPSGNHDSSLLPNSDRYCEKPTPRWYGWVSFSDCILHRAVRVLVARRGMVQQQQVDVVDVETFEAGVDGAGRVVEVVGPQLRGDEDVVA